MTLPERPGLLHAVPILNLFALLWLVLMLSPMLLQQSGVAVTLPPSRFQLERFQDTLVVTLGPGASAPRIHLGRDSVTLAELAGRFDALRAAGAATKAMVLLQTDAGTPVGVEREVVELVLSKGFQLAMVGANAPAAAASAPQPGHE